jgi:hypothetical protein
MLDDMFPFIEPIIEINENALHDLIIPVDVFFDFIQQSGIDRPISFPEGTKTGMPLDITMSLLRPDELEKLRNYVTAYMAKHNSGEA